MYANPELDDSKSSHNLLLSPFCFGERVCNVFPLSEYENEIIKEYRFALMEIVKYMLYNIEKDCYKLKY